MMITLLFVFFGTVLSGEIVEKENYSKETPCGDGVFDKFTEECDGTTGCGSDCFCMKGYTADGEGNCVPECVYGKACYSGCTAPNFCEICNVSMGYTHDCQGCQPGYMWQGVGKCVKVDTTFTLTCDGFFKQIVNDQYDGFFQAMYGYTISSIFLHTFTKETEPFSKTIPYIQGLFELMGTYARCSPYVDPTNPYTKGFWYKLEFTEPMNLVVEVDKQWTTLQELYLQNEGITGGRDFAISLQQSCPHDGDLSQSMHLGCAMSNGGTSQYVRSPRLYISVDEPTTYYMSIHSKFGAPITSDVTAFFTPVKHACSYLSDELNWNDVVNSSYSVNLDARYAIISDNACSNSKTKGFWYRFRGTGQNVLISTCNSPEFDTRIDLLKYKRTYFYPEDAEKVSINYDEVSEIDCVDRNGMTCANTRSSGCGANSKLAKMVAFIEPEYDYFLFIGINEEYQARIQVDFEVTCADDCGTTGKCSVYTGKCECYPGYIFRKGTCQKCGNGILDDGEECDPTVPGYKDSLCTEECTCKYGSAPILINGERKCAPQTCGNGQIDEGEECEGGYGCDHCICVNGTKKFSKTRKDCMIPTCGNNHLDEGEECDGGDGCVECECQEGWYANGKEDCSSIAIPLRRGIIAAFCAILYYGMGSILCVIFVILHVRLTKKIQEQIDAEKMSYFENTIIPFDKSNSQFVDVKLNNSYFKFSSTSIDFNDRRPEINEPIETEIVLTNTHKDAMHFTFHSGQYTKYDIFSQPFTGTVRPGQSVTLSITFIAKCTSFLNEKVPITIRYGQLQSIIREMKRANPDLIRNSVSDSQNSESERQSQSSESGSKSLDKSKNNSSSSLNTSRSRPSFSSSAHSGSTSQNSIGHKKKQEKARISKFHVYLELQIETALSTRLDYEEIHLKHPPIGGGTFGIVYRANWRKVDVACKVMKSDLVDMIDLLPNFIQEAEMMERIRCPYIVHFIGSVVTEDTLCLVTEFCSLGSLRKFMKTNAMVDLLKVRMCEDIAKGMEYLHENDILHRDLKTDNVLVYSKNPNDPVTAKVTDFGTSRSFIDSSSKIALQNIGTPVYMAPEINRKDQMTLKSDVYSFAICMLEVWLGKDPYDPFRFPDSESILKFVGAGKRLDIPEGCLLGDLIQQSWKQKASERPSFKEITIELSNISSKIADKTKSDSNKESKSLNTKSHNFSKSRDTSRDTSKEQSKDKSCDTSISESTKSITSSSLISIHLEESEQSTLHSTTRTSTSSSSSSSLANSEDD